MTTRYDRFFWQLRELQRALDLVRPQLTELQALPDSVKAQIDRFRTLEEAFTLPQEYLDSVRRVQEQLTASPVLAELPRLAARADEFIQEFRDQQRELALSVQRINEMRELARPPTSRIVDSLVGVEALLRSVEVSETLLEAALLPQRAFQDFVAFQLDRVAGAASTIEKSSRLRFVDAASELLDEMTKGFDLGVLMAPQLASAELNVDWEVNVFAGLSRKAEDAPFEDEGFEAEAFVLDSCEARIATLGQRLIRLVYDLNTEAEREGRPHIFKPTTKTLYACSLIPSYVAEGNDSFNRIVDQLYFLLYEGSGDAKRLMDFGSTDRFEALWRLKHLRREARHDVGHGSEGEIQKKQKETGKAFVGLAGSVVPKNSGDWCKAQLSLYEQLVAMLEEIWFDDEDGEKADEPSAGDSR